MSNQDPRAVPVPYSELAPELLRAVVESYVLREGTDYGEKEFSLQDKVAHVISQLERGDARIVFDPESQTVGIIRTQPP
ncbi:MAG: YheU family protein [Pseudomonadota bacterium]|nr:YheU family protein [Pseudomonadota bacterium]